LLMRLIESLLSRFGEDDVEFGMEIRWWLSL
jgi:hypothetical protein